MGSRTPEKKQDFRLEEVDDELLLYHPVRTTALYLNDTAALIWKLCDGRRSSVEIAALVVVDVVEGDTCLLEGIADPAVVLGADPVVVEGETGEIKGVCCDVGHRIKGENIQSEVGCGLL